MAAGQLNPEVHSDDWRRLQEYIARSQAQLENLAKGEREVSDAAMEVFETFFAGNRDSLRAQIENFLIEKAKLAENQTATPPTQVHNEYHMHGANSRINIGSTDQSVNSDEVFAKIRTQLAVAIADGAEQAEVLRRLSALEQAQGTSAFTEQLGTFLAIAANWTTVITPFLPALIEIAHRL